MLSKQCNNCWNSANVVETERNLSKPLAITQQSTYNEVHGTNDSCSISRHWIEANEPVFVPCCRLGILLVWHSSIFTQIVKPLCPAGRILWTGLSLPVYTHPNPTTLLPTDSPSIYPSIHLSFQTAHQHYRSVITNRTCVTKNVPTSFSGIMKGSSG